MAVKRLTTGEMISLTTSWVQKNHEDRATLAAVPEIQPLLPRVDDAHQALLTTQVDTSSSPRVAAIQAEEKVLDARHDDIIRGSFYLLTALSYLTKDAELAKALVALQQKLFPEGLTATQKSYREEAGQSALLKKRIEPADIDLLKQIKVFEDTLNDSIGELIQIGGKLGKLEDERASAEASSSVTPADAVTARNQWIRAINAIITVSAIGGDADGALKVLLDRIAEAERRADRRSASAKAPATADTQGAGDEPPKGG